MTTNIDEKKEAAGEITDAAAEQAASTAESAKEQAGKVASTAKGEAQQLATETKDHAQALIDEGRQQALEQSKIQRDKLVETLQTFGDDLDSMASNGQSGLAADLTRQVADRTRQLSSSIEGREPGEMLNDVKAYAQRKPGTFLLGALAAGVVAGRLLRGAKEPAPASGSTTTSAAGSAADPIGAVSTSAPPSVPSSPGVTSASTVPAQPTGALSADSPLGGDQW